MKLSHTCITLLLALFATAGCVTSKAADTPLRLAQLDSANSASDQLKIAALEGLMSTPPERALPLVKKVLTSKHSTEVKSRALFILGQIELPEAHNLLLEMASRDDALQHEAIRMIGISGNAQSLKKLKNIYHDGDEKLRDSVLQAFLIANDRKSVFQIASDAKSDAEFDAATRVLSAMGATQELRNLLDKAGNRESLLQAYAIAGDLQSLQKIASQSDNPEQRLAAIRNIGIVGNAAAGQALVDIYRQSPNQAAREAALQGLLIADHDTGVFELFQQSTDVIEKRALLQTLIHMDSDIALKVIDSALEEQ